MRLRAIRAFAWTFAALCSISVVAGVAALAFGDPSGAVISRSMLVAVGGATAVEVAAYRIASEALTNVVRHAGAEHCDVRFELNGALEIDIRDDGKGLPASTTPGVGLTSMRERAAELGGTLTVERVEPHGTLVRARLALGGDA